MSLNTCAHLKMSIKDTWKRLDSVLDKKESCEDEDLKQLLWLDVSGLMTLFMDNLKQLCDTVNSLKVCRYVTQEKIIYYEKFCIECIEKKNFYLSIDEFWVDQEDHIFQDDNSDSGCDSE